MHITWNDILGNITLIVLVVYGITVISTVSAIVFEKRDPVKTISWVLVILLIPLVGIGWYLFFGQNYRKQKIFSRKGFIDQQRIKNICRTQIMLLDEGYYLDNVAIRDKLNVIRLLINNSKSILTEYNHIDILNNGKETFDAFLEDLEKAMDHIHLEFYRIEDDEIGNRIREILVRKARAGCKVRMIFDDVGSWHLTRKYIRSLKEAGIQVFPFMEVRFPFFTRKVNFRNHRKILVIDGRVGFVGGLNIADKYLYGTRRFKFWRDTHLRLEGEAVRALQAVFMIDWFFVSGEFISDKKRYLPEFRVPERKLVQITACGPDSNWSSIMQSFFMAITTAREKIYISTPYFAPNESILTALITAALGGIDVRIILPQNSDSTMAYWLSISYISELLEAGIKVYLYRNGFMHAKLLMVDGILSSVGSANIDNRSFDLNFEVNALIYSEEITRALEEIYMDDLGRSVEVTLKGWKKRSKTKRIKESLARVLGPLY
jgi:cardiolipin synthase